jgi:hypothetical protein
MLLYLVLLTNEYILKKLYQCVPRQTWHVLGMCWYMHEKAKCVLVHETGNQTQDLMHTNHVVIRLCHQHELLGDVM